jgi:hypothetical protein
MVQVWLQSRRGRVAVMLAGGCIFLAGSAGALSTWALPVRSPASPAGQGESARTAAEGRPHAIEPTVRLPGLIDEVSVRQSVRRLDPGRVDSVSLALHALRLFGPAAECQGEQGREALLDVVLEHERGLAHFGGMPTLIDTGYGVRCRTAHPRNVRRQLWREGHPNQFLAVLGEVGVPLNRPLSTGNGRRVVRHLLEDALATFDLEHGQFEWSALAFALYLPPRSSWEDKYGNRYTFDDLARELMRRPFSPESPCAATHQLYSLTALLRADEKAPVLSGPVRGQLREYLRQAAEQVCRAQAADGNWGPHWYEPQGRPERPPQGAAENAAAVLATGHHVEWLTRLPPEMVPSQERLARAVRWLHVRLLSDPAPVLGEHYCPYSHAARVLMDLVLAPSARLEGLQGHTPLVSEGRTSRGGK